MWHVVGCIVEQHDLRLVVLAGVMCLFACATTMSMLARAQINQMHLRAAWVAGAGLVAGCGIWATHFIAMLAYQAGFPVAYDISLTLLSILIATGLCSVGFWIALRPRGAIVGGAFVGAAIGAMHYVGMAAVRAPALAIWDFRYVTASVIIGIVPMALAMRMMLHRRTFRFYSIGALIFTLAICSMHFTGMSAVTYRLYPVAIPNAVMEPGTLAIVIAAVSALIVALGLVIALVDHHLADRATSEAARLRGYIVDLESTKEALEARSNELRGALVVASTASQAKSQFLATMSHELRTPLNAVIGFSQMMEMETFGPLGNDRYKTYVSDIHGSAAHLLSVINDILDISCLDAGKHELVEEEFALGDVVNDALKMISSSAEIAGVSLFDRMDCGLPAVMADRRRLLQILINLLTNAIKFTPAGGQVSVSSRRTADGIGIAVSDTGIGIAAADIPRALEPFGQVDARLSRKYDGVGLGLSLAKQLIESHGGTLALESTVDVGTTVTIVLPASRIAADQSAAA
jgi:signal transduction histidine kinase